MSTIPDSSYAESSHVTVVHQAGKTFWDSVQGLGYPVLTVIVFVIIMVADYYSGWWLHPGFLAFGYITIGLASWVLFPHANFGFIIIPNLDEAEIIVSMLTVDEIKQYQERLQFKRVFSDSEGHIVIVADKNLAISEAHTLSQLDYVTDVRVLKRAIDELEPLVNEVAELRKYRGLSVAVLGNRAIDLMARVNDSLSSSDIYALQTELVPAGKKEAVDDGS